MKSENSGNKKKWIKPKLKRLKFNQTQGGTLYQDIEDYDAETYS